MEREEGGKIESGEKEKEETEDFCIQKGTHIITLYKFYLLYTKIFSVK